MEARFKLLVVFLITISITTQAQKREWQSIMMLDTIHGYGFSVDQVNNAQYGPENLFDSKLESCWVAGKSSLYLLVPQYDRVLNIFNGYGKSPNLYQQNSRVKKMVIHFYLGVQPEGYVSEIAAEYYLYNPNIKQEIYFKDTIGLKHINLLDSMFEDQLILQSAFETFARDHGLEINEVTPIIKLEIMETYEGTKYNDICVSELFFSDKYMLYQPNQNTLKIDSLYINSEENTLIAQFTNGLAKPLYTNKDEVVWLSEVSNNKKWVTLMTMPVESEGRGLTTYLLVNTSIQSVVNEDLEQSIGRKISQMFLVDKNASTYLNYFDMNGEEYLLKLE